MKNIILSVMIIIFIFNPFISSQSVGDLEYTVEDGKKRIAKILDDDNSKFTNIGNIGITITNFGTYGHAFIFWPEQPSCEYPLGSGIEHIFDGGLWIGGYKADDSLGSGKVGPFVTSGAIDASSGPRGAGFEFTNSLGDSVIERSSIIGSPVYDPFAISHQDFLMDYVDTNTTLQNGEPIVDNDPLGVSIHQETYAWNFTYANFFVILNYWIKNVSNKYLDSVFVGLWTDTVVRNTQITGYPSGSGFYNKGGNGYNDLIKIAYEFDAVGDSSSSESYIGIQFCGSEPNLPNSFPHSFLDSIPSVNYVTWMFRNTSDPNFFAPQNDMDRYNKMRGFFGANNRWKDGIDPNQVKTPSNRSTTITRGHFKSIAPGDSINVVFAIVCAKKFGQDPAYLDTEEQKKNLYANTELALCTYFGEDQNRNGLLDPGEDLDGDGKITRYIPCPVTTIDKELNSIGDFSLSNNYPNPFNPSTTIKYQLPEPGLVTIKVYDVLGNEIATLVNEEKPAGNFEIEFDGTGLPSGIYFYRLQTESYAETKKMVLLK